MAARSDSQGPDSALEEELDVLRAIYVNELDIKDADENGGYTSVCLTLHPATGDDVTQQFVRITVLFNLTQQYPDEVPDIVIKNPRGLAEEEVQRLQEDMIKLAEESRGSAMLFELIEMAKEILTEGNIPRCPCVVCLEHFQEGEQFTRTECYHYFHHSCLARYVKHALDQQPEVKAMHIEPQEHSDADSKKSQLVCPVCRTSLTFDLADMEDVPPDKDEDFVCHLTPAIVEMQRNMAEMYAKQKEKGGIIDLEWEKNKYLVNEETVVNMKTEDKDPPKQEDSEAKSTKQSSSRSHHNDKHIVAKYKGLPRRNRPPPRRENGNHENQRGENSEKKYERDNKSGRRDEDRRHYDREKSGRQHGHRYQGGEERGENSERTDRRQYNGEKSGRQRGHRYNEGSDHRGGSGRDRDRQGSGRYRDGYRGYRQDHCDHSDMKREVDRLDARQSHQRHGKLDETFDRNANNNSNMAENDRRPNSAEKRSDERSEKRSQQKPEKHEDWDSERTVVSPDKLSANDEDQHPYQKKEIVDKGRNSKSQKSMTPKCSEDWNEELVETGDDKTFSRSRNVDVEGSDRHNMHHDRYDRGHDRHYRGNGRGHDRGHGGRGRGRGSQRDRRPQDGFKSENHRREDDDEHQSERSGRWSDRNSRDKNTDCYSAGNNPERRDQGQRHRNRQWNNESRQSRDKNTDYHGKGNPDSRSHEKETKQDYSQGHEKQTSARTDRPRSYKNERHLRDDDSRKFSQNGFSNDKRDRSGKDSTKDVENTDGKQRKETSTRPPPGIKIPEETNASPSVTTPPGFHITGPPPGFYSKTVNTVNSSSAQSSPLVGTDFR